MSYNSKIWLKEQESSGAANWEELSKSKPWYPCITKNNVQKDDLSRWFYIEHGTSADVFNTIMSYYLSLGYDIDLKMSGRAGYISRDSFAVMPYSGQWGRGWIIATSKTNSLVTATYVLLRKGGSGNGIANYYQ